MTSKEKEYLGDAILEFLAREYVILSYDGFLKKVTMANVVCHIVCNKTLTRIAQKLNIKSRINPDAQGKYLADEIEIIIFETFNDKGIAGARRWFYDNIVPNLKN